MSSTLVTALTRRARPRFLVQRNSVLRAFGSTSANNNNRQGVHLHHEWLTPKGADASHVVVFLHGLLGNGRNLRTMAKKMCETAVQPGLLLDLRGHGQSALPQPQTTDFEACVRDLQVTFAEIPQLTKNTPMTLVGHSWGGRVALQYAFMALKEKELVRPKRVWLLDTVPGQANESVEHVISAVTEIASKGDITDRKEATNQLIKSGIDQGTAQWLASSLQKKSDGTLEFGFDLNVANDLLPSFQQQDFLGMLQAVTEQGTRVDLVRGGKTKGWTESVMEPLEAMEGPNFGLHVLPKAGHWVHVEDLPGLLQLVDVSH